MARAIPETRCCSTPPSRSARASWSSMTGPSGSGKTTLLTLIGALRSRAGRRHRGSRSQPHGPRAQASWSRVRREYRLHLPGAQSVRFADRLRKRQDGDAARATVRRRDARARHGHSRRGSAGGSRRLQAAVALRRPAAARGGRPRPGEPAETGSRRRAHRRARPGLQRAPWSSCSRSSRSRKPAPS